ncbi:hypothetical protein HH195_01920 [Sarcina sp. JB2]|uniref:Uncharacterized protein n=1 Tax=Candidatus Sarcina troglodytae TaxID=2726954 RepID=A0ACD1BBE7_9CLOT|nr:hypothetical protein [Sarcina sp. JB2]QPJ84734.1 hypothetical protein HH195_01920 [Sarcina sp. JB2]
MSKNLQKTLAGALATMSVMSIATPVMATTVDIDTLYKNAYDAMRKAQETEKQTDINAAMDLIWELRHVGDERKDENLINAACTWSSLVDEVQHPKLVKIVTAITKAQETGRQADINEAFATIEPELPAVWRSSYTSAIDLVQQKLQDELVKAVEKAEADKTEESIKDARELVNEVLTANSEAMVEWAKIFEAKLDNIVGDGTGDDDYLIDDEIQDGTGDDDCLIDQEAYDLKITDVEVNRKQIKVTFDALEKSLDDVTLTVVDNNGNEVKVKSVAIIKKGATEAKFEFNNYLPEKPTGVWTINGEKFNLTEKAFVKEVKDASNDEKLGKVLAKEEYKDLVTYNKDRLANYVEELQKTELKEVKDIQDIIDKVDAKLDKEESSNAELNKYIDLLKKVSKNGTQEQFNNVLNEGVEAKYIKDVNPDYMEDYKKEIEKNSEDIKEIANIQTQIKSVNDGKQKEADQKNEEAINKAKTDLKTALEESDKKAILEALQNSLLGLDNVKAENIDHYVLDKENIKHKLEKHTGLEKVNEYLNMINEKADVVNANTLENMIKALGKFSQTRNFGDFNNLSTVKKQDTAEELLRNISSQEKQYSIGDLEKEIVKINKDIEGKLENLNVALDKLKKERKEKKADDLTLPLRNALKEIIGQEVSVEKADKFYNNSFDSKGELVEYSNYTDIRTALNK